MENYQEGIESIVEAYPSVDIIVNSTPPLGQKHSNQNLTQSQVDEYNKALVQMCQEKGWKFLNSAEVLKDSATGYAKSGYVESSDGIHLTRAAMEELFDYVRTHSYITEDDRPTVKNVAKHVGDKDVSTTTAASVTNTAPSSSTVTSESEPASSSEEVVVTPTPTPDPTPTPPPAATPEPTPTPPPAATPDPAPTPPPEATPEPTPTPTQEPTPTPTQEPVSTPDPTEEPTSTPDSTPAQEPTPPVNPPIQTEPTPPATQENEE